MTMTNLDYQAIYKHRFLGVDSQKKLAVWAEIAAWIHEKLGKPARLLDVACGDMEFLGLLPQTVEAWGIDFRKPDKPLASNIRFIQGDFLKTDLPAAYFDAVFISNLLEHLHTPEEIQTLLEKVRGSLRVGGVVAIMGPNFRFCFKEYFNFADHRLCLTEKSIEEYLVSAGFSVERVIPKFLPFSFTGRLPSFRILAWLYLRMPWAWPLFGKQFLVFGRNPQALLRN